MRYTLAHSAWVASSLPDAQRWWRATHAVAATQSAFLRNLVHAHQSTWFGQHYRFAQIRSVADFQAAVPLLTYEEYVEPIDRIAAGEQHVLTHEPVSLLEPTSGSTSATKLIPYTPALQADFQRALAPWIVNLFMHNPQLMHGPAYWSVSPATYVETHTSGGLPIGFEADSAYFGRIQQAFVETIQLLPNAIKRCRDWDSFRYVTLLSVLHSANLRLISVWNPTFLELLVEPLYRWRAQLVGDLAHGTITPPVPLEAGLSANLRLPANPQRAHDVASILELHDPGLRHSCLWPHLRLISCWCDAQAAPFAARLSQLFPQAQLQAKGLLATEGCISFPLVGYAGAAVALRSHFFEWVPVHAQQPVLTHELKLGQQYRVVITTSGGLYRYQLNDVVEVVGFVNDCPLIKFIGKYALVSDHFGEKVHALQIQACFDTLFKSHSPDFALVACEYHPHPHYGVFIQSDASDSLLEEWARQLEDHMQHNVHYAYCRQIGQLGPFRPYRIEQHGLARWTEACYMLGQRPGDIKPTVLHRAAGWRQRLYAREV